MKIMNYSDNNGYHYKSLVRDGDFDPSIGILQAPPDLRQLDWEMIVRNIHNELLARGLITLQDVQIRNIEFNQLIMAKVVKPIYALYQQQES
jgi:hypothetical protein